MCISIRSAIGRFPLSKRKLETKIGGASKTVSFKDEALFAFIQQITQLLKFNGPVDMDFFFQDGVYYLSEVNPALWRRLSARLWGGCRLHQAHQE